MHVLHAALRVGSTPFLVGSEFSCAKLESNELDVLDVSQAQEEKLEQKRPRLRGQAAQGQDDRMVFQVFLVGI